MPTLLIADDSEHKITFLQTVLKHFKWNGDTVVAKTTEEAKSVVDQQTIDYAFIDYEMPSENGPAVIAYLREKNPTAKIAMVTSLSDTKYKDEAKAAGADTFVCTAMPEDQTISALKDVILEWSTDAIA